MMSAPHSTKLPPAITGDPETGSARGARSPETYTYFFVCGVGRSGTNWIGNLLNLHPRIQCTGEWHFQHFYRALREFTGPDWQMGHGAEIGRQAHEAVHDLIRRCMAAARTKPAATHLGDRSPRWYQPLLPGAPTICVVRDGRDVLVSHMFHFLRVNTEWQLPGHLREGFRSYRERFERDPACYGSSDPGLLGWEPWVRHYARKWAEQVKHDLDAIDRAASSGNPSITVAYEELHSQTESQRARMYRFLGLDPEEAGPLSPHTRTTPGFASENRGSLYRKGAVGEWETYAADGFRRWFGDEANDVLVRLGYEPDQGWMNG